MDTSKNLFKILATIALMFILPYLGALIAYDGKIPHSLFLYAAVVPQAKASFNIYIFVLISLIFSVHI